MANDILGISLQNMISTFLTLKRYSKLDCTEIVYCELP